MVDGRCLFVGTDMPSNVDGVNWLLNEIWPRVRHAHPNASLHICGTVCRKLDQIPEGVSLMGLVDDLEREYEEAIIVVVPLRAGSGVKIKLTEAIGFKRCCVSTRCGIEGLPAKSESGVLVSDTPEDFAVHINTLLGYPGNLLGRHDRLGQCAPQPGCQLWSLAPLAPCPSVCCGRIRF
jgi:hypothetical protein